MYSLVIVVVVVVVVFIQSCGRTNKKALYKTCTHTEIDNAMNNHAYNETKQGV